MGILSFDAQIKTEILQAEELKNQLTDISMDLRLTQKQTSAEIDQIHAKYAPEKERIRNEIEGLDKDEMRDQYADLMGELNDIKDQEEADKKRVEEQSSEKEEGMNLQKDNTEARLEATNTSREKNEEARDQLIQEEYGYFQ